jgi:dipeptide/tripeptide permease
LGRTGGSAGACLGAALGALVAGYLGQTYGWAYGFGAAGFGMLLGLVFDIVVASKDSGAILRAYRGCSYASGSMEVQKHAILMQQGVFNALDVSGTGA